MIYNLFGPIWCGLMWSQVVQCLSQLLDRGILSLMCWREKAKALSSSWLISRSISSYFDKIVGSPVRRSSCTLSERNLLTDCMLVIPCSMTLSFCSSISLSCSRWCSTDWRWPRSWSILFVAGGWWTGGRQWWHQERARKALREMTFFSLCMQNMRLWGLCDFSA